MHVYKIIHDVINTLICLNIKMSSNSSPIYEMKNKMKYSLISKTLTI